MNILLFFILFIFSAYATDNTQALQSNIIKDSEEVLESLVKDIPYLENNEEETYSSQEQRYEEMLEVLPEESLYKEKPKIEVIRNGNEEQWNQNFLQSVENMNAEKYNPFTAKILYCTKPDEINNKLLAKSNNLSYPACQAKIEEQAYDNTQISQQQICIENQNNLQAEKKSKQFLELYQNISMQQYFSQKFNLDTRCERILQEFETALIAWNRMNAMAEDIICDVEKIDTKIITKQNAETIINEIQTKFDEISNDYTKYFIYTPQMAKIENCITFYTDFHFLAEIKEEENKRINDMKVKLDQRRPVIQEHGFKYFYGEDAGIDNLGINAFVNDLQNHVMTVGQAKNYAIFEPNPQQWKCENTDNNLIKYTNGNNTIAVEYSRNIEPDCEKLPYDLLFLKKKIENPKKEYSLVILKFIE